MSTYGFDIEKRLYWEDWVVQLCDHPGTYCRHVQGLQLRRQGHFILAKQERASGDYLRRLSSHSIRITTSQLCECLGRPNLR